jgi:molecular chaperone DnaJ
VPTIGGKVKIKIDAGTQSGKILRLRGKGIKDINGYGKGDQLIHINEYYYLV